MVLVVCLTCFRENCGSDCQRRPSALSHRRPESNETQPPWLFYATGRRGWYVPADSGGAQRGRVLASGSDARAGPADPGRQHGRADRRRGRGQPAPAGPRRRRSRPSRKASTRPWSTWRPRATTPPRPQHDVEASQQAVKDADAAIAEAQKRFDTFRGGHLCERSVGSYLTARSPDDMIATAPPAKTLAASSQAGDGQPAAGPHRAGEQGVGGPAGQAEGRQGRRRRARPARTPRSRR